MKYPKVEPDLVLYATSGCHLCERAESVIREAVDRTVRLLEIADDDILLERYGIRIPVLRRLDTGEELDWPFDAAAVQRLLGPSGFQPRPNPVLFRGKARGRQL